MFLIFAYVLLITFPGDSVLTKYKYVSFKYSRKFQDIIAEGMELCSETENVIAALRVLFKQTVTLSDLRSLSATNDCACRLFEKVFSVPWFLLVSGHVTTRRVQSWRLSLDVRFGSFAALCLSSLYNMIRSLKETRIFL